MFLKRETHNRLVVKEKISKFVKGNTLLQQHTEYNANKASLELQKLRKKKINKLGLSCAKLRTALASYQLTNG